MVTIEINSVENNKNSMELNKILDSKTLDDIVNLLFPGEKYRIKRINERNFGRCIVLKKENEVKFVSYSRHPMEKQGRNSFFQSFPTCFEKYLKYKEKHKSKDTQIYFYLFKNLKNVMSEYHVCFYRILMTIFDCKILNLDYYAKNQVISPFKNVKDLIKTRNSVSENNSGNKPSYIVDEGDEYALYGKVYGANAKESSLLAYALLCLADKKMRIYNIIDNSISRNVSGEESILRFNKLYGLHGVEVDKDAYTFGQKKKNPKEKIRNGVFNYNLLKKFNGEKKCVVCNCPVESIVEAAHIFQIHQINELDIKLSEKKALAKDGQNGLFLCVNHHELFDSDTIIYKDGKLVINDQLKFDEYDFVKKSVVNDNISNEILTDKTKEYFKKRYNL